MISEKLNIEMNNLVGECFKLNRMLDRGMSLLNVRWRMKKSSSVLHESLAHVYLGDKFADSISDYQGKRGNETIYPQTPIGNENYETPLEFIKSYHNMNSQLVNTIKDVIEQAKEEGDWDCDKFLGKLLRNAVNYHEKSSDLLDVFESTENDKFKLQLLDNMIENYI